MSRRTIEQIRKSVVDEIEHQNMLDRKAEMYRHNKAIYDALKRMSKLACFCALSDDGTLWIYEGTFESMMNVYRAIGMNMVEVVRCKDCIHNHIKSWNHGKRDNPRCRFTDIVRSNLFYCGFGERANTCADMRGGKT